MFMGQPLRSQFRVRQALRTGANISCLSQPTARVFAKADFQVNDHFFQGIELVNGSFRVELGYG